MQSKVLGANCGRLVENGVASREVVWLERKMVELKMLLRFIRLSGTVFRVFG
jgi:hypothetical protein